MPSDPSRSDPEGPHDPRRAGEAPGADHPSPSSDVDRSAGEGGLPGRQLERVIRRAVELQYEAGHYRGDRLSEEEVVRIGREVGIEPQHVRRALLEYRGGALAQATPWEPDRLSTLLGPSFLRATRAVPGDPESLQRMIEEHFRARESLQAVRRLPGISLWEPAGGVLSAAQRALNVHGLGYQLARTRAVELAITDAGERRSVVTLTADVRNVRADSAWGWIFLGILAVFAPTLVLGPVLALPQGLLWAMGAVLGGGVALLGTRRNVRRETGRIRMVMEGLLDRLEGGEPLQDERPSWRDRLLP